MFYSLFLKPYFEGFVVLLQPFSLSYFLKLLLFFLSYLFKYFQIASLFLAFLAYSSINMPSLENPFKVFSSNSNKSYTLFSLSLFQFQTYFSKSKVSSQGLIYFSFQIPYSRQISLEDKFAPSCVLSSYFEKIFLLIKLLSLMFQLAFVCRLLLSLRSTFYQNKTLLLSRKLLAAYLDILSSMNFLTSFNSSKFNNPFTVEVFLFYIIWMRLITNIFSQLINCQNNSPIEFYLLMLFSTLLIYLCKFFLNFSIYLLILVSSKESSVSILNSKYSSIRIQNLCIINRLSYPMLTLNGSDGHQKVQHLFENLANRNSGLL